MKRRHYLLFLSVSLFAGCSDSDIQSPNNSTSSVRTAATSPAEQNGRMTYEEATRLTAKAEEAAALAEKTAESERSKLLDQPLPAGGIEVNPRLGAGYMPYISANSIDTTNGRLAQLLDAHRKSCIANDPNAFYELFNQRTRYLYTQYTQKQLQENFLLSCSKDFLGLLETEFRTGNLIIAEDGQTEDDIRRQSLCKRADYLNGICNNEIELSIEKGALRWGWH